MNVWWIGPDMFSESEKLQYNGQLFIFNTTRTRLRKVLSHVCSIKPCLFNFVCCYLLVVTAVVVVCSVIVSNQVGASPITSSKFESQSPTCWLIEARAIFIHQSLPPPTRVINRTHPISFLWSDQQNPASVGHFNTAVGLLSKSFFSVHHGGHFWGGDPPIAERLQPEKQ